MIGALPKISFHYGIIQFSLNQPTGPIHSQSCNVCLPLYVSVCDVAKHPLEEVVETSCQRAYCLYWSAMTQSQFIFPLTDFFFAIFYFLKLWTQPSVRQQAKSRFTVFQQKFLKLAEFFGNLFDFMYGYYEHSNVFRNLFLINLTYF